MEPSRCSPGPSPDSSLSRILIIDDDAALLEALADTLAIRLADVQIETCSDSALAVDMVQKRPFDLIFCDLCMPGTTGLELLPRLRSEAPDVVILAMSAAADDAIRKIAVLHGATQFVAKPFDRHMLTMTVKGILQERHHVVS